MQDKRILGLVALRDEPREDAARGIATLAALGIRAVMLTGDNARTATAIAGGLGLEAKAGLLPDGKLTESAGLRRRGGRSEEGRGGQEGGSTCKFRGTSL